jgi:biotin operon repressor
MSKASGRREVADDRIITAVRDTEEPFATAEELSERLDISRQGINQRLRRLREQGFLERKQCGSGYGWWVVERID